MVCEGLGTVFDVARTILDITGHQDIELLPSRVVLLPEHLLRAAPGFEMMINAKLGALGINRNAAVAGQRCRTTSCASSRRRSPDPPPPDGPPIPSPTRARASVSEPTADAAISMA